MEFMGVWKGVLGYEVFLGIFKVFYMVFQKFIKNYDYFNRPQKLLLHKQKQLNNWKLWKRMPAMNNLIKMIGHLNKIIKVLI
jgi:hypothetical protein